MSKKTYEIGDTIEWDNVPRNGTMIRQGRNYATRIGDDGTWNHVDGDPAWWSCRGAGWQWALNGSGAVTIVALDLTGEESAGDLRKRAEIFEVREVVVGLTLPVPMFKWHCRDALRAGQGMPPDGLFNATVPCGTTICGVEPANWTRSEMWHLKRCGACRGGVAERLHAAGWRPGDSAERAAELLAGGTR